MLRLRFRATLSAATPPATNDVVTNIHWHHVVLYSSTLLPLLTILVSHYYFALYFYIYGALRSSWAPKGAGAALSPVC